MNKFGLLLLTAFSIVLLAVASAAAQKNQIVWEKDFKKSLADARAGGKPVLLFFTAPNCPACQQMDEQYWASEAVIAAVKQFVAVRVNFDTEKPLAARYNVPEAPFVAFTDPLGNLISFRRGFDKDTPRRLNVALKDVTKDFSSLEKYYQAVEQKKDDGNALLAIADSYRGSGNLYLSSEFYKRAVKTPEISGNADTKERVIFALGINAVGYRDYKQAIDYLEDYLKNYPKGTYRETAVTLLVVGSANLEKFKESDKYLAQLKTEFPDSQNIAVAVKAVENAKNKRAK